MNPWPAIQLSLLVAFVSSSLLLPLAAWLGYLLDRGKLKTLARWWLSLPLSLPPLASGVLLLWLFSPLWPVGAWFSQHGMNPVLTWYGAVLASSLVALPLAALSVLNVVVSPRSGRRSAPSVAGSGAASSGARLVQSLGYRVPALLR